MKFLAAMMIATAALSLAACGDERELDTSYEEEMPSPLPEGDTPGEPVPDNTSIEGGPDEQVDEAESGDAMMPEGAAEL